MQESKRGEWSAEKISDESGKNMDDEIKRQILRGDETEGDPDKRDVAGGAEPSETWQGREENKTRMEGGTT